MNFLFDFGPTQLIVVFIILFVAFTLALCAYLYDKNRELRWRASIQKAIDKKYEEREEKAGVVVEFRRPED